MILYIYRLAHLKVVIFVNKNKLKKLLWKMKKCKNKKIASQRFGFGYGYVNERLKKNGQKWGIGVGKEICGLVLIGWRYNGRHPTEREERVESI